VLFHTTWEFTNNSEEAIQRNLAFFSQWKPPDGFEFKGFWGYADGSGGVAIVETDSAATIAKATGPFTPWLRFSTTRSFRSRKPRQSLAKPRLHALPSAARGLM
jgi:Protein of unknown function (DUF3303)